MDAATTKVLLEACASHRRHLIGRAADAALLCINVGEVDEAEDEIMNVRDELARLQHAQSQLEHAEDERGTADGNDYPA